MTDSLFTPPRGLQRFRITYQAVYFYHRRFTLSFCWRLRWHWWPQWNGEVGAWYGWSISWGFWELEKLNFGRDDWGIEAAEIREAIFQELGEAITSDPATD